METFIIHQSMKLSKKILFLIRLFKQEEKTYKFEDETSILHAGLRFQNKAYFMQYMYCGDLLEELQNGTKTKSDKQTSYIYSG